MATEQGTTPSKNDEKKNAGLIEITTADGKLVLKQFSPSDAEDIFELVDNSREHLSQNGEKTAENYPTLESVANSINNPPNPARLRFTIRVNEGKLAGSINLTPNKVDFDKGEIGYYLGADSTGRGYMVKALELLTDFALSQLNFREVYAIVAETNTASAKVLQKAGYIETGRVRDEQKNQNQIVFSKKKDPAEPAIA